MITTGEALMDQAVTAGWISSYRPDTRFKGFTVIATQKLQRAFKASFGYSFGREAYVGLGSDLWNTIDQITEAL